MCGVTSTISLQRNVTCPMFMTALPSVIMHFQGYRKKICVQLYSDEFEVCNLLASKRGKHKLVKVYF